MGSLTRTLEVDLLDHVLNNVTYTPASSLYLALCTADPTETATGSSMNEVANSNNYARVAITFGSAASRKVTQSGDCTFNTASGDWGTITHWAIVTSGTYASGDVLAYGAFNQSKSVVSGNTPSVSSGSIYIEMQSGEISDYLANKLLDFAFGNVSYSSPSTYLVVTTVTITDSDTGSTITEPSGGSYARVLIYENGGSSPYWSETTGATPSYVTNGVDVSFAKATASWGTITSAALCDASTGGNLLWYDNDMTDQAVGLNDILRFLQGDLQVKIT